MNHEQTASLLAAIAKRQAGERHPGIGADHGTAPVELSVGYVAKTGMILHDGIVIKDAPPVIIATVQSWLDEQHKEDSLCTIQIEVGQGGLIIR